MAAPTRPAHTGSVPRTGRGILSRLTTVASRIAGREGELEALYAERDALFLAGRSIDPRTEKARTEFSELAAAAGVSEPAIHKAIRKARLAAEAGTERRGRFR